jgi:hypothetical protein
MRARTPRRSALLVTGAALVLLAVSACGGSSSGSDSTSAVPAPAASGRAVGNGPSGRPDFTAYRDCMAKNGVTLPDFGQRGAPGGQGSGAPSSFPTAFPSAFPSGDAGAPGGQGGPGGPGGFALPDGVDQATFDKAQTACASLQPQIGNRAGGGQIAATALAAFKSCLSDHSVTVGDSQDWFRQLDRTDPKVAAALKTCAPLLPQPGGGGIPPAASAAAS